MDATTIVTFTTSATEDRVYHNGEFLFAVAPGLGSKAAKLQVRCWREQSARHYTAASRLSAQIESLTGYRAVNPGENL